MLLTSYPAGSCLRQLLCLGLPHLYVAPSRHLERWATSLLQGSPEPRDYKGGNFNEEDNPHYPVAVPVACGRQSINSIGQHPATTAVSARRKITRTRRLQYQNGSYRSVSPMLSLAIF